MSYEELKRQLETDGGVTVTVMGVLRDIEGAGRLGTLVRANISGELSRRGICHYPDPLPNDQNDPVRLYLKRSRAASVIDAVLNPSVSGDELLREPSDTDLEDVSVILRKIRELLPD